MRGPVGRRLAGLVLAALARLLVGAGARRRGQVAHRALRARIDQEADPLVIAPVERELAARRDLCTAASAAGG